jgi:protein PhnA
VTDNPVVDQLVARAGDACELCLASRRLRAFPVPPESDGSAAQSVLICGTCRSQIEDPATMVSDHWAPLGDSMWSPVPAVQVVAWRMLRRLKRESWASDLFDMLYLDDETRAWAEREPVPDLTARTGDAVEHRDAHGAALSLGDTVTLVKDLVVKGAGFTAKRGTAVRNITLVHDNAAHIEGRVEGQRIVILTEFVKKS